MRTPRSARSSSAVSSSTTCTARGSLSCAAASSRARSPGSTSARRRNRPSALDTTLWATTTTSWDARSAGAAASMSPARSSPGRTSGSAPTASTRSASSGLDGDGRPDAGSIELREGAAGALRTAARAVDPRPQRREVAGRVDVERERRHALDAVHHVTPARDLDVAVEAVRPEARRERAGRRDYQRVGAGAMAVWHDADAQVIALAAHEQLLELDRVDQRGVARDEQDALEAVLARVLDADLGGLRLAGLAAVRQHGHAIPARQRLRHHVVGDHGDRVHRLGAPKGAEHVAEHGLDE